MIVQCLVDRDGDISVTVQRSTYIFKDNGSGLKLCEMNSGSHIEYLLKISDFKEHKEPEIPIDPVKFICDRCNNEFANAAGLSGHKRSKGYQDEPIRDQNSDKGNLG